MPIVNPYKNVGAYKVTGPPDNLKPLFMALPDIGDIIMRQTLAIQYITPLERLEVPYEFGQGIQRETFQLFARPVWKRLTHDPADKVPITAHLIFYWRDRSLPWSSQPSRRITETLARIRVKAIEDMLAKGF